ncbi:MAG: biopolymer transporter ExbD [Acidobacteria bacterium]|nr:biopolymer transporter ExbD [Acidobacteriota bacterium]
MPKVSPTEEVTTGRNNRVRRVSTSMAEINVVPLVDVMLVLLIIFMVTAPMLQRGVDVNLPVARRSQQITDERVFVTVPLAYRQNHVVRLGDEPVPIDVLAERMRQLMDGHTDRDVFLRGDGGIQLQELLEVMDRLKEAGVQKVGIVSRLPEER